MQRPDRSLLSCTPPSGRSPAVGEIARAALSQHDLSPAVAVRAGRLDRRQLTILVCKMVGSTPPSARLDPEDMRDVIAAFHKVIADTVARFDGFVAQYQNDGAILYFGYPSAHEYEAE